MNFQNFFDGIMDKQKSYVTFMTLFGQVCD